MGKIYQVKVFGVGGEMKMIDLCTTEEQMKCMTVLELKKKISEKFPWGDDIRLIFTNIKLDGDGTLLSQYGIQHLSVIQMVLNLPGGLTALTPYRETQRPS